MPFSSTSGAAMPSIARNSEMPFSWKMLTFSIQT